MLWRAGLPRRAVAAPRTRPRSDTAGPDWDTDLAAAIVSFGVGLASRKATKPNTWKDGIAVGEWLVTNGYKAPSRMGIFGGSAGGIFVGLASTERPDLFAAEVPAFGVMDMLRTEASANGVANIPEFGTVQRKDEFKALLAMSSCHHLRKGTRSLPQRLQPSGRF